MPGPTYASYLGLDTLLGCLAPLSERHDERLFITIHQAKELWLRQVLDEIDAAQALIEAGQLSASYKCLARVSRIQAVLTLSWDVLTTMTPADYSSFRAALGESSGFQSDQFRALEFRLGLKDANFLRFHEDRPYAKARLEAALAAPSLYDATLRQLPAHGVALPAEVLERDVRQAYHPIAAVEEAWAAIYAETERFWDLYQLAEKLVDIDDALLTWRYKHVLTVERIIGAKRGTGGTEGVGYLQATLKRRCFPELWSVRTRL